MLRLHNAPTRAIELSGEFRFVYEWFAGWRWECHRNGELLAESLQSFESREECVADAKRRASRRAVASGPVSPQDRHRDLGELAA